MIKNNNFEFIEKKIRGLNSYLAQPPNILSFLNSLKNYSKSFTIDYIKIQDNNIELFVCISISDLLQLKTIPNTSTQALNDMAISLYDKLTEIDYLARITISVIGNNFCVYITSACSQSCLELMLAFIKCVIKELCITVYYNTYLDMLNISYYNLLDDFKQFSFFGHMPDSYLFLVNKNSQEFIFRLEVRGESKQYNLKAFVDMMIVLDNIVMHLNEAVIKELDLIYSKINFTNSVFYKFPFPHYNIELLPNKQDDDPSDLLTFGFFLERLKTEFIKSLFPASEIKFIQDVVQS
jgi:hypothetical protein